MGIDVFRTLDSDITRWLWVANYQHELQIQVFLDNDDTFISIGEETASFANSIGNMNGIFDLLSALGVDAELV